MNNWTPRTYYILRNKTTGMKYMGQTTKDINSYLGSGTYWQNHCKSNGGLNKKNIEVLWHKKYKCHEQALEFLELFFMANPLYQLDNEYANLVCENTHDSPLTGNMDSVFHKNGNPFKGGRIQREAHKRGCYDNVDYHELAKNSWKNKEERLKESIPKMVEGYKKFKENNPEKFKETCKAGGLASKLKNATKIVYKGKLYYGWNDLMKDTGISKYVFKKYNLGEIL